MQATSGINLFFEKKKREKARAIRLVGVEVATRDGPVSWVQHRVAAGPDPRSKLK